MRNEIETVSNPDADELSLAVFIITDELELCVEADDFAAVVSIVLGTIAGAVARARAYRGPEGFEESLRAYARAAARAALAGVIVPTANA